MMKPTRIRFVVCGAFVALLLAVAQASDTIGVYCLVERVAVETDESGVTTARIWGAFSFAVPRSRAGSESGSFGNPNLGDVYGPVQEGYVYYICPAGQTETCRREWADLESVVGKGEVVGIGGRHLNNGRVRSAGTPSQPDPYPINVGVVRLGTYAASRDARPLVNRTQYPDMVEALRAAVAPK